MPEATEVSLKTTLERAKAVKKTVLKYEGKAPSTDVKESAGLLSREKIRECVLLDMKSSVREMDALRVAGPDGPPVDLSFAEFTKQKFGFSTLESFYDVLGFDPNRKTVEQLRTMPEFEEGFRWLIPEIIREAVRLGLRRAPVYTELIAATEAVSQTSIIMPHVNMSNARMEILNEAETIPVGNLSFGQKTVKIHKMGTGLKITDEVLRYVSLNVLSIYLQDAGVKLGLGMDVMALDVLINGDEGQGNAAPVIGVATAANGITYRDILRAWIRMGRLGRTPQGMISDEDAALNILEMAEFKGANYNDKKQNINLRTPIPANQAYLIHGNMPGNGGTPTNEKLGLYDSTRALLKLDATGIIVESERIAEKQINGTYITQTTGFAKMFRDAFVILDGSQAFASAGWPAFMDVDSFENVVIQ